MHYTICHQKITNKNIVIFKKSDSNFDVILNDQNIKQNIEIKLEWEKHLMLFFNDLTEDLKCYLNLKFSELIVDESTVIPDRRPKIGIDYNINKNDLPSYLDEHK